eukprot:2340393-Rhodomonas_salina.1
MDSAGAAPSACATATGCPILTWCVVLCRRCRQRRSWLGSWMRNRAGICLRARCAMPGTETRVWRSQVQRVHVIAAQSEVRTAPQPLEPRSLVNADERGVRAGMQTTPTIGMMEVRTRTKRIRMMRCDVRCLPARPLRGVRY